MMDILRRLVAFRAAAWLSLAAAPSFALMAVVTGILDRGAHQMSCSTAMHMSPFTGMVPMYALMSAFHLTPWLGLVSRRAKRRGRRPRFAPVPGFAAAAHIEVLIHDTTPGCGNRIVC